MAEKLKITMIKSMISRPEKHKKTLRAMGLTKIGKQVEMQDIPSVRGMIRKVEHLVKVEEI
ncbi:MAG: 50S ribosomal protein L30 [Desulforegulaceae bacterium]|nr:50S ribosomal protein L30 [Desulforegulaceae bacterium]